MLDFHTHASTFSLSKSMYYDIKSTAMRQNGRCMCRIRSLTVLEWTVLYFTKLIFQSLEFIHIHISNFDLIQINIIMISLLNKFYIRYIYSMYVCFTFLILVCLSMKMLQARGQFFSCFYSAPSTVRHFLFSNVSNLHRFHSVIYLRQLPQQPQSIKQGPKICI